MSDNADRALAQAVKANDHEGVRRALASGADPNREGFGGSTPLMDAAWKSGPEVVRALIDGGADVNKVTIHGFALSQAALYERRENIDVLLGAGAFVSLVDQKGRSALVDAVASGSSDLVRFFLQCTPAPEHVSQALWSGWEPRPRRSNTEGLMWLIAAGADLAPRVDHQIVNGAHEEHTSYPPLNQQDRDRRTILCHAARLNEIGVVRRLLDPKVVAGRGGGTIPMPVNLDIVDKDRRTALMTASAAGHRDIVELLLAAGAERYHRDRDGRDARALAAAGGHDAMAPLFDLPLPDAARTRLVKRRRAALIIGWPILLIGGAFTAMWLTIAFTNVEPTPFDIVVTVIAALIGVAAASPLTLGGYRLLKRARWIAGDLRQSRPFVESRSP